MKIKKTILLWGVILGLLPSVYSYAQDQETGEEKAPIFQKMREHREKKIQEIYAQLDLTDEQKKVLENNKTLSRQQMKTLFESMKPLRDSLNQELMKADLDMNRINEIQSQIKAVQSQIADNRLNSILEVRRILTPEQFAKFIGLMDKNKRERWNKK